MRGRLATLATLGGSVVLLSGCGSSVSINITCGQYVNKSPGDQRKIATTYLKQVVGDSHPGAFATGAAIGGLDAYCPSHSTTELSQIRL